DEVKDKVNLPMISIIEATYDRAQELGARRLGLLGTKFTMEHDFFQKPFRGSDIELFVPEEKTQKYLHQKIVDELENGIVKPDTKHEFLKIVEQMADVHQLDGLILGC